MPAGATPVISGPLRPISVGGVEVERRRGQGDDTKSGEWNEFQRHIELDGRVKMRGLGCRKLACVAKRQVSCISF